MKRAIGWIKAVLLVGAMSAMAAPAPGATYPGYVLMDENSQMMVNFGPGTAGVESWAVDGVEQLGLQWFWFRLGDTGPEYRVDSANLTFDGVASGASDTDDDPGDDVAYVLYHGGGFDIEIKVSLDGGAPGSGTSDVAEQVSITNTSTCVPLDFHFYQYADFNLGGSDTDAEVNLAERQGYQAFLGDQADGATPAQLHFAEVGSETMSRLEADDTGALYADLTDADADDLNNNPTAGPGDLAWAYQWDFRLLPGEVFQLSKDKMITPEPATLALMGSGAVLALFLRRRR